MKNLGSTRVGKRTLAAMAAVILGLAAGPAPTAEARDKDAEAASLQLQAEAALRTLFEGDADARLAVAERASMAFAILEPSRRHDSQLLVAELRRYLRNEEDDWVAVRFLDEIDGFGPDVVDPIFLDALDSASPNLRWKAYQWFSHVQSSEALLRLESTWVEESRPWAAADLIEALSRNGSTEYSGEFLELATLDHRGLASAAIEALESAGDDRAVPMLASFAKESEDWRRMDSVKALRAWPASAEALEALLAASEVEDEELRTCALSSLSRMDSPQSMLRVLSAALTDPVENVRKAAIVSLNTSRWPEIVSQLLRQIPEGLDSDRELLDPYLQTLPIFYTHWQEELAATIRAREVSEAPDRNCQYFRRETADGETWRPVKIVPPRGMRSSRCLEHPGTRPHLGPRVPDSARFLITDHFEVAGASWVEVIASEQALHCWVPESQIAAADAAVPDKKEDGVLWGELDIPLGELTNPDFSVLEKSGTFKIVDSDDELATVSVLIRLGDPRDEATIRRALLTPASLASEILTWMLRDSSQLCAYPELVQLLEQTQGIGPYCPVGSAPPDTPPSEEPEVEPASP